MDVRLQNFTSDAAIGPGVDPVTVTLTGLSGSTLYVFQACSNVQCHTVSSTVVEVCLRTRYEHILQKEPATTQTFRI